MAKTKPEITVIPAKKSKLSAQVASPLTKRRTAAYARVSTVSHGEFFFLQQMLDTVMWEQQ